MSSINLQQRQTCATILSHLDPGYLPIEIFSEVARLVRLPIVMVLPVRIEQGVLQIALIKRDEDDLWWPNMWHLPGTVFRSTDTMETCIERLINDELLIVTSDNPVFRSFFEHKSLRGAEVIFIHTVENCAFHTNSKAEWFAINALPEDLVDSEQKAIGELQKYF